MISEKDNDVRKKVGLKKKRPGSLDKNRGVNDDIWLKIKLIQLASYFYSANVFFYSANIMVAGSSLYFWSILLPSFNITASILSSTGWRKMALSKRFLTASS